MPRSEDMSLSDFVTDSTLVCEIAGMDECGLTSPRGRFAGKTNLPKVLLTSNPLMDRDLQKKLDNITLNQTRRVKTLEWNQRHFLVSQIFDENYNLRFTDSPKSYSNVRAYSGLNGRATSSIRSAHSIAEPPKAGALGLGIFMPPLPPSQRFVEKQKIRGAYPDIQKRATVGGDDVVKKNPQKVNSLSTNQSSLPVVYGSDYPRSTNIVQVGASAEKSYRRHNYSYTKANSTSKTAQSAYALPQTKSATLRKSKMCISLPDFNAVIQPVDANCDDAITIDEIDHCGPADTATNDTTSKRHHNSRDTQPEAVEILCQEDVVTKLTRTLPMSLMIKANRNINKEVQKRKNVMIARCKRARDVNTLEDPRWRQLERILLERSGGVPVSELQRASCLNVMGCE